MYRFDVVVRTDLQSLVVTYVRTCAACSPQSVRALPLSVCGAQLSCVGALHLSCSYFSMLREFFCSPKPARCAIAWVGLFFILAASSFFAYVSLLMNSWYKNFYNLAQVAASVALTANSTNTTAAHAVQAEALDEFWSLMRQYLIISAVSLLYSPLSSFVSQHYGFQWRVALMESYVEHWSTLEGAAVEGASQRVHEDTQRFASLLRSIVTTMLKAVFTAVAFTPRLLELSAETPLPTWLLPKALQTSPIFAGDAWLLNLAAISAVIGMGGAVIVGRRLVTLDINNQRVEAELRKRLVIAEDDPRGGGDGNGGHTATLERSTNGARATIGATKDDGRPTMDWARSPAGYAPIFGRLSDNYASLFFNFLAFNVWVGGWSQYVGVLPFVLIGPRLFDLHEPIQIGALVQLADVFSQLFAAFTVAMENWDVVNEYRAVCRRLAEFEAQAARATATNTDARELM